MENSFHQVQAKREAMLPPEIEHRLLHQISTFTLFGKVVELFVPNALDTCARFIDGDCNGRPDCDDEADEDVPEWRFLLRGKSRLQNEDGR